MTRAKPLLLALAGAAVLVALFFVLRPDDDEDEPDARPATTATETTAATETDAETDTTEPEPPPPPPAVETIRIQIRGGNVLGERPRPRFERGDRIRLHVGADVTDHVHVHGYDLMRDVSPGNPAIIRFRATMTGRFEVELEDRGLQIAEIEVRP